jgi:hypothetical protein
MFPGGGGEGAGGKNTSSAAVAFVDVAFVAVAFDVSAADIAADPPGSRRKCRDERGVASRSRAGETDGDPLAVGGGGHRGGGRMACRAVACGVGSSARDAACANAGAARVVVTVETATLNVRHLRATPRMEEILDW